jgi:threonyl-tRNA synthetase
MERFIGVLIEHTAGNFPLWLAPVQAIVLPIAEDVHDYAREVYRKLHEAGIRAEIDLRSEKIGKKIREAEVSKIPCMLVIGRNEQEAGEVSLRRHRKGDEGRFAVSAIIAQLREEIDRRS